MRRDKRRKSLKRGICLLTADVLAAAAIAGGIYGYDYMIPHGAVQAAPLAVTQKILEDTAEANPGGFGSSKNPRGEQALSA